MDSPYPWPQALYKFLYTDIVSSFKDIRKGKSFFEFQRLNSALIGDRPKMQGRRMNANSGGSTLARLRMGKQLNQDSLVDQLSQQLDAKLNSAVDSQSCLSEGSGDKPTTTSIHSGGKSIGSSAKYST